jgi:hypothetical protein
MSTTQPIASASTGVQPASVQQNTSTGGIDQSFHGISYQTSIYTLFSCSCGKHQEFRVEIEKPQKEKFDDVFVHFKAANGESPYYIQSKYKNDPMEMTLSTLFEDPKYQLKKYFESFQEIKNSQKEITNVMIFTNNTLTLTNPVTGSLSEIELRLDNLTDFVILEEIPANQIEILDKIDEINSKFRFKKEIDTVDIVKDLCEDYTFLAKELVDACFYKNNKNHQLITNITILW